MTPSSTVLLTDLYELTMAQAYLQHGMTAPAVFEFFVRRLPPSRRFLIAAGLEQVLEYLLRLELTEDDLRWLESSGRFTPALLEYLRDLRFTGDVDAMPEGTLFFPHEPILRVTAPLPLAQLVESRVMNLLNFQTMIASKAARSVLVAGGKPLIDFGMRRAHGAEAGLLAARASYLAGFAGTATVLAGMAYGIPLYGTMAHSFVQAHEDEAVAFEHFAESQPDNIVLLLDTYDTEQAARKVVRLAPEFQRRGLAIKGVRLDSGDLGAHARNVRRLLDDGGLRSTQILASGNLDEYRVKALVDAGAPIDSFAVGTAMTTSADAPALDCAYKLQAYAGRPCRKRSEGKATWPGPKQVYRHADGEGRWGYDVVATASDQQNGSPLLEPVVRDGRRTGPVPSIAEIRRHVAAQLERLPSRLRDLDHTVPYEVRIASSLQELARALDRKEPAWSVSTPTQGDVE